MKYTEKKIIKKYCNEPIDLGEVWETKDKDKIDEFIRKGQEKMAAKGLKHHTLEWSEGTCKLVRQLKEKGRSIINQIK